jgi:hypothetical protein
MPLAASEKCKRYRAKLREDPEQYANHLEKERGRYRVDGYEVEVKYFKSL